MCKLLPVVLSVFLIACAGKPESLQIMATVAESPFHAISTGCQAVEPGEEGSCYVLFGNYSDAVVVLKAVRIETDSAQITQQPAGLPKRIEPNQADGVYWYFISETTGSVVFDFEWIYSYESTK